jgi:hypothetical protein
VFFTTYYYSDKIKKDEMSGACSMEGKNGRDTYRIFVGKHEWKNPFPIPKRRQKNNIKIDLKENGMRVWTGFIWLRTGISGGLRFHKRREIS